jgi:hypothetical protein
VSDSKDHQAFSLQAGIDPGRFTDPVRMATASLRQGTLVAEPPLVFAADASHPIYGATVAWAQTERSASGAVNILNLDRRPEWGIIVTQTCDLVEEGAKPKRPWVHIAPVYRQECNRGERRRIERERGFDYLCPITGLDSDETRLWVADLRLLVPAEKGLLVDATTADGFTDESGHDRLGRQLSRLFSRPAYPTSLVRKVLQPLTALLADLADSYDGDDPIIEVGLALGRSRADPSTVQVVFILDGALDAELHERLISWGQATIEDGPESIHVLLPQIVSLDDLSARDYRKLDPIDISAFSPAEDLEVFAHPGVGSRPTDTTA